MSALPEAPAATRNATAILKVLGHEFRTVASVLEIGSGTGQHAVTFAAAMPDLSWQTSDVPENHPGILAWLAHAKLDNALPPLTLDVLVDDIDTRYDAVFSANTAHIMNIEAVAAMFELVGRVLDTGGVFCLYGPFRQHGRFNTASNEQFHRNLVAAGKGMGIRDLEKLDAIALDSALERRRLYAMPANNLIVVWHKLGEDR